jgi:hypothetical protein
MKLKNLESIDSILRLAQTIVIQKLEFIDLYGVALTMTSASLWNDGGKRSGGKRGRGAPVS